jgi:hypothetical protein
VKFEWTSKCEDSFEYLKDILNIAYMDEDFVMCTDACKERFGGVPTEKYHVVCYESIS